MVKASRIGMLLVAILLMVSGSLVAQAESVYFKDASGEYVLGHRCGTHTPTLEQTEQVSRDLASFLAEGNSVNSKALVTIPVAVHVVAEDDGTGDVTDAMINDQMQVIIDAYADSGLNFTFSLASIDRTYNTAWSTHRYGSSNERKMKEALAIDPATTFNLYICNIGGGLLGYATFPYMYPEDSYMHGVVILYGSLPGGWASPYNEGDTLTHELGHFLGLYHTFQGGCAAPNDYCDDTPPEAAPAYGCPIGLDSCAGDGDDPIHNFMDYSDDYCMDHFTGDQSFRCDEQMALYRPTMTGGTVIVPGPSADFSGTPVSGTFPLYVVFTDLSTNGPTSWGWTFGDGGTSSLENPNYTYDAVGTYTVSLTVANADGSDTETKTGYIVVTDGSSGGDTMHVADINVYRVQSGRKYYGRADITIQDDSGAAVAGATVTAVYSGDLSGTASGVTGTDGVVTLSTSRKAYGTVDFCFEVTAVDHASLTYDDGANLVTKSCESGDEFRDGQVASAIVGLGNQPNPFNPMTEIEFSLVKSSNVSLIIYNLRGQVVKTLVDQPLEAGQHFVKWDARGHVSGVYFCHLIAGDVQETHKMVLLK